jgi:hypothetical protein
MRRTPPSKRRSAVERPSSRRPGKRRFVGIRGTRRFSSHLQLALGVTGQTRLAMAYVYVDESIHERAGFILISAVATQLDLSGLVSRLVRCTGVEAREGEFKSSTRMVSNPGMRRLRDALTHVIAKHCRIGLAVGPLEGRADLGQECILLLEKLFTKNRWPEGPHSVLVDQGIDLELPLPASAKDPGWTEDLRFTTRCDSRVVVGIQLADLAAHSLFMILLQGLGMAGKILEGAGPDFGYDEEAEIDLGFAMWAPWRYNFFAGPLPSPDDLDRLEAWFVNVGDFGLHVAASCSPELRAATQAAFGRCYLGCMH